MPPRSLKTALSQQVRPNNADWRKIIPDEDTEISQVDSVTSVWQSYLQLQILKYLTSQKVNNISWCRMTHLFQIFLWYINNLEIFLILQNKNPWHSDLSFLGVEGRPLIFDETNQQPKGVALTLSQIKSSNIQTHT